MSPLDRGKGTARDQAIAWLVRVQSDTADMGDWADLTRWLEASDVHRIAFDEVELLDAKLSSGRELLGRQLELRSAQILPFVKRPAAPARTVKARIRVAASSAAIVILSAVVWSATRGTFQTYRTHGGETKSVALADGTRVRLDAATVINVRLGWRERRVDMGEGEVAFDVAKDAGRPFVVSVGDQRVQVVGTEFDIAHFDGLVVVTVRRGQVRVGQPDMGDETIAQLTKGAQLRHVEGSRRSDRLDVDPDVAFAWTSGRLVCEDRPLSSIVTYLNRHYSTPIQLSRSLGARRFSGVLELGDQTELVHHLAHYLSLSVDRTENAFVLR